MAELDWFPVTYPATTTSAVMSFSTKMYGLTSYPAKVDFLQNGTLITSRNFNTAYNTSFAISLSPGTYQFKFTTTFDPSTRPVQFYKTGGTNQFWNMLTSATTLTTGNITITAGATYDIQLVDAP